MKLFYHRIDGKLVCAAQPLDGFAPARPGAEDCRFLFQRPFAACREAFAVGDLRQLAMAEEDVSWLDAGALPAVAPDYYLQGLIAARRLRAVNRAHPRWRALLDAPQLPRPCRVHVLALGDVGANLLVGMRLLGGGCVSRLGIFDLEAKRAARWEFELNQIMTPDDTPPMPEVEIIRQEQLFDCDVFIFCASAGVPGLDAGVADVRMAQYAANRRIIAGYARQARQARFRGLFAVVSDPVDLLCRAAYMESNRGADGGFDGQGLLAAQVQGYGLGVMYARAAYYAKKQPRFASFLRDGAVYGPHGGGLVVADSLTDYDDARARELTSLVTQANLHMRNLGFKPYVAPALSSGALAILATLRGEWHHGATLLGKVFFGARTRHTPAGVETDCRPLPPPLRARLSAAARELEEAAKEDEA